MGLIVMLQTIQVNDKYFIVSHQYEYTETATSFVSAHGVDKKDIETFRLHYLVTINNTEYWVPSCACVEYDKVLTHLQQNKTLYHEFVTTDQTRNPVQAWKEVTGIQIDNKAGADIDLRAYQALVAQNPSLVSKHEDILP